MRGVLIVALLLSGCASAHYEETVPGQLEGEILVRWIAADKFIFVPVDARRLTFTPLNGEPIAPGSMYTDGGSVPRQLWGLRNYSPWGYAPAFIIHDWLFEMQHCRHNGYEKYTLEDAARIMSEAMKTVMLERGEVNKLALYAMYEAVRSPYAAKLWSSGVCDQPPDKAPAAARGFIEYIIKAP